MESTLDIQGHGLQARRLSHAELRAMPRHELGAVDVLCLTGRQVSHVEKLAGARLTDILNLVGLAELPRAELKQCIIVAEGQDGYRAVFSWNELHNTPVGNKVQVLYEQGGTSLDAHLGALCLISANDLHLGPRHLRSLCRVSVQML